MVKIAEFLEKNKMDYEVIKRAAMVGCQDGTTREVEGQWHLVRSTDGEVISPSTVSDRYAPMNPSQLVEPLTPLVEEGWISPDKGFLFKGGSYEVISFRIDGGQLEDSGKVAGEDWRHYLSVHNHQGGGGKVKGSIHSHRVVCENTAVAAARMASFGIRHTGEVQKNYDWAVQTWKKLKDEVREISRTMEIFADQTVSAKDAVEIIKTIHGVKGKLEADISTRTANELAFTIAEFSNPQRGTYGRSLADIINAITSTNTHYKPKNSKEDGQKRLSSLFDEQGSRHKLEASAMSTLRELAGIAD